MSLVKRLSMLLLLSAALPATGEPVFVMQGKEFGNGYVVTNGEGCFLVTAEHVIADPDEPIRVLDATRRTWTQAQVVRQGSRIGGESENTDVAVAKVENPESVSCRDRWDDGDFAAAFLRNSGSLDTPLTVTRVLEDGSMRQQRALIRETGTERITLQPNSGQDKFARGDSGSFITIKEGDTRRLIGMIVRVESNGDLFHALPQAWLHSLIGAFVVKPKVDTSADVRMGPPSKAVNLPGGDYRFDVPDNLQACEKFCVEDARCRSYTFVEPGAQAATALCWLKHTVPTAFRTGHTTSGVKLQGPVADHKPGPNVLNGMWTDAAFPTNTSTYVQTGDRFTFTGSGQFPDSGERFETTGSGSLAGNAVTLQFTARYSTGGQSTGTCAGSLLEGPGRQLFMGLNCSDSRLGRYPANVVKSR